MFSVNDIVMYGTSGVCEIVDMRQEKFGADTQLYYVLKPVYDEKLTIYAPVTSEKLRLRKLLSPEQVNELIDIMPDAPTQWIDDDQLRKEKFNEILRGGDHRELIKLIKTIYYKNEERAASGKRPHLADERAMKEAQNIIYGEFAHVLNIKINDVLPFIMGKLK